jgi:hypothetical protein
MNIRTFHPEDPQGLVKGLFGCIDGRDWAGLSDFLHDEAIYDRLGYEPFVAGYPGFLADETDHFARPASCRKGAERRRKRCVLGQLFRRCQERVQSEHAFCGCIPHQGRAD